MSRDYYILALFLGMVQEIRERVARGQTLNPREKMVAMLFMVSVFDSFKRICARESIDSRSIFHHAQQDLLHGGRGDDTSSQHHLEAGTPEHHSGEF